MSTELKLVLNAEQYYSELDKVIRESKRASGKIETGGDSAATGTETLAESAKKAAAAVEEIGKKDALDKVAQSAKKASGAVSGIEKSAEAAKKAQQAAGGLKQQLAGVWKELRDGSGRAQEFAGQFKGMLSPIGLITAGIVALGRLCGQVMDAMTAKTKRACEAAEQNAASLAKAAERAEAYRTESDRVAARLQELASAESLSNTHKKEAVTLIKELEQRYGKLGVTIDQTTGKLRGVDQAIITKAQADKQAQLDMLERLLAAEKARKNRYSAGMDQEATLFGMSWFQTQGQQAAYLEYEAKFNAAVDRIGELQDQIMALRKSDPAGDSRRAWANRLDAADAENMAAHNAFSEERLDAALAGDPMVAVGRLQSKIDSYREDNSVARKEKDLAQWQELYSAGKYDAGQELAVRQRIADLNKELLTHKKQIYSWEQEIARINAAQAEKQAQLTEIAKKQREEQEKLQKARIDAFRGSIAGKAETIAGMVAGKNGAGEVYAVEKAVRDAEKTKGDTLSGDEKAAIASLARLEFSLANPGRSAVSGIAGMGIQTNALTARGGFAEGAVAPEKDRINEAIKSSSDAIQNKMREAQALLRDIRDRLGT